MLKDIAVPTFQQIASMSSDRCRQERTRLKNEISFARGNSLWGGPSAEEDIVSFKNAIEIIERRLQELATSSEETGDDERRDAKHQPSHEDHDWWKDTASYGM